MQRHCPDCAVSMESTTLRDGHWLGLTAKKEEREEGIFGKLGVSKSTKVKAFACPECGLLRLYLDE